MVSLESLKHSDRLREEIRQALSQLLGRSLSETPGYHARALIDAAEAGKSVISVVKTNSVLVLIKVFSSIAYRYLILSVFIKHWLVVFDSDEVLAVKGKDDFVVNAWEMCANDLSAGGVVVSRMPKQFGSEVEVK